MPPFETPPSDVYPAAVADRGNRLEAKSKAEDTEKERLWFRGRGVVAVGVELEGSGFSLERESLREDEIPDGEERREAWEEVDVEEARDASSRESRGRLLETEE